MNYTTGVHSIRISESLIWLPRYLRLRELNHQQIGNGAGGQHVAVRTIASTTGSPSPYTPLICWFLKLSKEEASVASSKPSASRSLYPISFFQRRSNSL